MPTCLHLCPFTVYVFFCNWGWMLWYLYWDQTLHLHMRSYSLAYSGILLSNSFSATSSIFFASLLSQFPYLKKTTFLLISLQLHPCFLFLHHKIPFQGCLNLRSLISFLLFSHEPFAGRFLTSSCQRNCYYLGYQWPLYHQKQ